MSLSQADELRQIRIQLEIKNIKDDYESLRKRRNRDLGNLPGGSILLLFATAFLKITWGYNTGTDLIFAIVLGLCWLFLIVIFRRGVKANTRMKQLRDLMDQKLKQVQ